MSDITKQSLTELVENIKDKKLSSTEVTKAFIERSEKSKELNAYITEDFTSALEKANKFNSELEKNNIDAIIDDTDENFSSKIKKMNLIGAPYQIIIGKQTEGDLIEFKEVGKETKKLKIAEIIEIIKKQKEKN